MDTPSDTATYLSDERVRRLTHALARAEGHLRAVRGMVEDRRCADEVLTQLAAVRAAVGRVMALLLESELRQCLTRCGAPDAEERFDAAMRVLAHTLRKG